MSSEPGSSSSRRSSTCVSRATAASSRARRSATPRSSASSARATTLPSAARPGRRRRPSARSLPTTSASSRASATRPRAALGHRDWFALSLATDELDEGKLADTLAEADRVTAEPFGRWKGALDERLAGAVRLRGGRPAPVALRGSVLPGDAARRRPSTSTRSSSGQDIVALARRTLSGVGLEVDGDRRAKRPVPARRQEPARVLHRHRSLAVTSGSWRTSCRRTTRRTRCSTSSATASTTSASGTDLPWLLRSTHLVATEASALLFGALAVAARLARARSSD